MSRSLEKLGQALKISSSSRHHDKSSTCSNSLSIFRSKVSDFISQNLLKPKAGSKFLSLEHFSQCFELIQVTNRAFAKFALELDYPTSQWGSEAIDEQLNYTSILLEMINSSAWNLNRARLSSLSSLGEIESPIKIPRILTTVKEFRFNRSITTIEKSPGSDEKESLVLEASLICKKTGFLALGMILSGLCSDVKPYMEIRDNIGGFSDQDTKALDLKFIASMREMEGFVREVEAVNVAMDCAVSKRSVEEWTNEVKTNIGVLESSLNVIENNASELFSEVLARRNELMDNLPMSINKH